MGNLDFKLVQDMKFPGAPLMMIVDMGPMQMTLKATELLTEVDPSVFEAPEGNYKEMTMEELQGMGLDGFGF